MTKYDLAKLFCDVDDRFIEGAKPEAQKPVMVKVTRCSPIKLLAAASCAAVILAGGALTLNALHNRGTSAFDSSNIASILKENSNNSVVSDEKTGNWYNDEQIYYEGEYYTVPQKFRERYKNSCENSEINKVVSLAGLKKRSKYKVEMVTVLKNNYTEPVGIRCYGYDSVVEMGFCRVGESIRVDSMEYKPIEVILQPGEVVYQKSTFNVSCGDEYRAYVQYAVESVGSDTQHKPSHIYTAEFRVMMTDDVFIELGDEELDFSADLDGDGIPDKLKELNPHLTDEDWEKLKELMEHPPER